MRRSLSYVLIILALGGCTIAGPTGSYEGTFSCRGKGVITGTGQLNIAAGIGGGQQNSFTLNADCGDGFEITRERVREKPELPAKP